MTPAVTVLGSSGMYATTDRACAGYLLELNDAHVWMDAGAGTWRNLVAQLDYGSLDAVLLTHRHPDHTTDVFQAFHARQYGDSGPLAPIPLWAPAETLERLCAFGGELEAAFELRAITPGDTLDVGGARFSFVSMAHPVDTLGVRVELDGAVLAYSSDTGPDANLSALAHEADLFICEATLQDSDKSWEGHTSASQAGALAAQLRVHRLMLTHLPPGRDAGVSLDEARRTCGDVPVELATDGMRYEVGT
ncbi:MAG: MBL fold metallo-hydrolase [Actinomycetota bacterium]